MSEQPRARAVAGQRAAGGRRSARQGVAPATLNPRIHRRGTHGRKWLTPSHRAGTAIIAAVPHIRNKTGPYCTFPSSWPVQAQPPAATGNPDVKPQDEPWLPSAA